MTPVPNQWRNERRAAGHQSFEDAHLCVARRSSQVQFDSAVGSIPDSGTMESIDPSFSC